MQRAAWRLSDNLSEVLLHKKDEEFIYMDKQGAAVVHIYSQEPDLPWVMS